MISLEVYEKPDSDWNNRLLQYGLGNHNQTKERGIHFERQGKTPLFLHFVDNKGNIIAQLLLAKSQRFEQKTMTRKILKKLPGLKKMLYFWIYGPIIFEPSKSSLVYSELGRFLLSKNCRVFGTTNPMVSSDISSLRKNFQIKEWATYCIDLKKSKEEIYEKISKHSGRKNIERSIKKGVTIEEINEKSLLEYSKFIESEKTTDFESGYKRALAWWRLMEPLGRSGFLARWNEKIVGCLLFYYFNNVIIEGGVVRSSLDTENKLYSQDLIKWKILEWGMEHKMRFYDLSGHNPYPETKKEEGIKRYKAKWGGKKETYWFIKK